MSEVNVQLGNGQAAQMAAPITVADALKKLDRDVAKQALAARVNGREVDLPVIEKKMRDIAKRNMPYRRDEISKADALRIFKERDEPLKCELIDEKAGEVVSVYYIDGSPFIDFCLGPHVPNTNRLKAFKLLSLAGAYWKGDSE